ncbi:hypothetical protein D3C71_1509970 [compost metagenome]
MSFSLRLVAPLITALSRLRILLKAQLVYILIGSLMRSICLCRLNGSFHRYRISSVTRWNSEIRTAIRISLKLKKSFRILLQWHNACNLFGSMHLGLNWSRSEAPLKLLKSLRTILTRAGLRLVLLLAQQLMGWRLLIGKLQITTTTTRDLSLSVRRR